MQRTWTAAWLLAHGAMPCEREQVQVSGDPVDVSKPSLAETSVARIAQALRERGLWFDLGAASMRVQSDSPVLPAQLQAAYGWFPFADRGEWADVHLRVARVAGVRRWFWPQVELRCDGAVPFDPFPADSPLPLLEWGCNWTLGQRLNNLLLLHAGVVERDGFALVLPATPGSGKSTLTAALAARGWRLMSDEFGAFDPSAEVFRSILKPVALKNQSIDVIRQYDATARFGPEFPKTRKGRVAHLAASAQAVRQRRSPAKPGIVVLPKWQADVAVQLEPLPQHSLFAALAFNSFNYTLLGAMGFEAVVRLVRQCAGWQLVYSNLDEALAAVETIWTTTMQSRLGASP